MPDDTIIGIDLGTTNSLVAVLQDGLPVLIPNALGEVMTPSAVSVDDAGTVRVGADARALAARRPEHTVTSFKRDMATDRSWALPTGTMNATQLSALVLAGLKADAEAYLGHPVREAVITVPAYFGDAQRRATREAGEIAGFIVERIINEPTAAALAYGVQNLEAEQRIAVVDLGGGTFDVTVLEIIEGIIEIQSSAGDTRLGGDDFVQALVASVAPEGTGQDDPDRQARLFDACERAMHRLSAENVAAVVLPAAGADRDDDFEASLTASDAELAWQPLLKRVENVIGRALRDAGADASAIDEVIMVGGASRLPSVRRLVARLFGRLPRADVAPDIAVAHGAAVQAALKAGNEAVADVIVTDIAPFTMGVETVREVGSRRIHGVFSPVIERGTVIPASRVERFHTVEPNQRQITLCVYQGEHATTDKNTLIGSLEVPGIPRGPAHSESVDVRFTYDLNGILEVDATIASTNRTVSRVFHDQRSGHTPAFVENARKQMAHLKVHPRETLPNRTALERAEACWSTLRGAERAMLSDLIAEFRGALDNQEPAAITAAREQLNSLVAHLRM